MIERMCRILVVGLVITFFVNAGILFAKDEKVITPKETGVYVKTNKGLKRILPNIVFTNEQGVYYIVMNNPAQFLLKDFEYFVMYGNYQTDYLTLHPMPPLDASLLGKQSFMFGKIIDIDVKKQGKDLYIVKPKGLLGRGYLSLWIEDTAWDFILD